MSKARELLKKESVLDDQSVPLAVHNAYIERLHAQIEAQVLSRYGLTLESFHREGKEKLSDALYADLVLKLANVTLSLQMIVAGFNPDGLGHLIYVSGQSAPANYDAVGFCTVGSGSPSANSMLLFHADAQNLSIYSRLEDCIYCCCEAKFMAESASDVGHNTFLTVLDLREAPQFISGARIDTSIRKYWERSRKAIPRKHVIKKIPDMMYGMLDMWSEDKTIATKAVHNMLGSKRVKARKIKMAEYTRMFKAWNRMAPQHGVPGDQSQKKD